MDKKSIQRVHLVTLLITFTAAVFFLFYHINKGGPFREINPFGVDPYDAVGSFAIQVALLVGLLTYARTLRLLVDAETSRMRLIVRGNLLVLLAILVTLAVDVIAVALHPLPPSDWAKILLIELGLMILLAAICLVALVVIFGRMPTEPPPRNLTPADAIDDLWTLLRVPVTICRLVLPPPVVAWVGRFNSDRLFGRIPWLNPRLHPWRFACVLGILVGAGLVLAQLQEGLPPSLPIALLLAGIFISVELTATLAGFAIFGGYLGLRPPF